MELVIVELADALPSCLASWADLFSYAERLALRRGGAVSFQLKRWSPGQPPPPPPAVALVPARILKGSLGSEVGSAPPGLTSVLREWAHAGTGIAAVCAGVFPVAEAGLLDGRAATTHWSLAGEFRRRFPGVDLREEALLIEEADLIIGGGMTAYFDVGLRVIRRFAGEEVARDCSAVFVLDPERRFQSPFSPVGLDNENDPILARAVGWASNQESLEFSVEQWASAVAVVKRTLERRAQAAWGFGPAERLRRLRLDRARLLVAGRALTWEEVTARCGYRDSAAFRRQFLTRFGQTPGEYRRRFGVG